MCRAAQGGDVRSQGLGDLRAALPPDHQRPAQSEDLLRLPRRQEHHSDAEKREHQRRVGPRSEFRHSRLDTGGSANRLDRNFEGSRVLVGWVGVGGKGSEM